MSPDEIRAAAETYHELGPAYRDAVIESFLDKVSREIDTRVDTRLAQQAVPAPAPSRRAAGSPMVLAVISMALGIPISVIAVAAGSHPAGALGLIVAWTAIAIINVVYNVSHQSRRHQPPEYR